MKSDDVAEPLSFVRFKDPNEALGLAVRLLAGTSAGPFEKLPLGVSARMLTLLVDRSEYGFATRDGRAVGFVAWTFVPDDVAEGYLRGEARIEPDDFGRGPAGVVFAFRAVDAAVTRFLTGRLRDVVFAGAESLRFIRDYGDGSDRPARAVVMRRTR